MTPIDELLIRDACLQLMTGYCVHLDARDETKFLGLFTEDAVLTKATPPAYEARGRSGIRETFTKRPPSILSRHLMLNHVISVVDNDNAEGSAVGLVVRGNRDRETWPMPIRGVELVMDYRLRFRREAAGWRISRCDTTRLLDVEATPVAEAAGSAAARVT
jgi:SnoaL-like domain